MIADGKKVAEGLKQKIKQKLSGEEKVCFIIFGDDPGSRQFIKMKCRFAESLGIHTIVEEHPETVTFDEAKKIIQEIVSRKYSGIVIQLPLPKNLEPQKVLNLVPESLDIDVLGDKTKQAYINSTTSKVPPVARAIEEILNFYNIALENKKILVIGTGKLVGEPVANMLKHKGLQFSQIDKNTPEVERKEKIKNADIIISGAGDSFFIKPDMIKDGVVLIDAGTSESEGKIVGDVDSTCFEKASLVTPVPGGVGPVTLASLFLNL